MPPRVLTDLVVLPPGHGSSVTDFWGWDAYEAQLRCPNDINIFNSSWVVTMWQYTFTHKQYIEQHK